MGPLRGGRTARTRRSTLAEAVKDPQLEAKQEAALRAAQRVRSGMVIGLGSGSTARLAVREVGRRLNEGQISDIVGIPTSRATRGLAISCGVPLTTLEHHPHVDLFIDGADEVDPHLDLIKGGGGSLLWEKIVATATRQMIIVIDESKQVARLGLLRPLPVEVVVFGWGTHEAAIRELGGEPVLRVDERGKPRLTDEGHYILDCRFHGGIADPERVERTLKARTGVVETGLFLKFAPEVIVGHAPSA